MPRWLWAVAAGLAIVASCALLWWSASADTRALRALPDAQRLAVYQRTMENLKNTCDPAAPRSLRDFCRREAELAAKFEECDADPACQELVRRHLFQPHR